MSIPWESKTFDHPLCAGNLVNLGACQIQVNGTIKSGGSNTKVVYWAADEPNSGYSYYGSGHPYANPEMAYSNNHNKGHVYANGWKFSFTIKYPNAYYIGLGSQYVAPHFNVKICDDAEESCSNYFTVQIDDGIPFRTLTYPAPPGKKARSGPSFYYEPEREIRSQEEILRQSAYPLEHIMSDNLWGDKPPK